MEKINVISPLYKNLSVDFGGFIVKFNSEGKGILEFNESDREKVDKVLEVHSHIYKGDELPIIKDQKPKIKVVDGGTNIENDNSEIDFLKKSNVDLALENSALKKENQRLKEELDSFKDLYPNQKQEQEEQVEQQQQQEEQQQEEQEQQQQEEQEQQQEQQQEEQVQQNEQDEEEIRKDLNKKTVAQLKEILNSEDFLSFKDEWKGLTKKDDIINYILNKIKEN